MQWLRSSSRLYELSFRGVQPRNGRMGQDDREVWKVSRNVVEEHRI
jgi:hypothetical protein